MLIASSDLRFAGENREKESLKKKDVDVLVIGIIAKTLNYRRSLGDAWFKVKLIIFVTWLPRALDVNETRVHFPGDRRGQKFRGYHDFRSGRSLHPPFVPQPQKSGGSFVQE